ncbi:aspartate/glutamate racemase family protein [Vreelandella titanicae]|jgi:aspartate racemase|uniref:Aspartate racemase n=1 Tax=Vreelandella titanicae BH1 TaxID=1204738 RepID=L9UBM2_9GAMM|nr:aspartate/glutamate racemase family protein [Halomonas titanicae]ELY21613.1 Aspartate racemase [Halomonas titanicae BH1]NVE90990.1 aspartate/glutamate racemase family protein [Halomonas titanicae]QNU62417.1 aspartate/glutamate racemase family protein [Halomonas titanicae]|tara:strand:+ start:757 stop:1452 length:696 start_codon:yes stop_codon:yes gene_type:complete
MRVIGVLGGMSWESTQGYYRALNEGVKAALGGFHSAKIVMVSVDFAEIEALQQQGDWHAAGELLASAAQSVERAGADCLLIATNTMHKVAPAIEQAVTIPLLHIADATAEQLTADGITRVGLLGTRFTMEQDFYIGRLEKQFGIEVVVPDQSERDTIHRVIFDELCQGRIKDVSRQRYLAIIDSLHAHGAQAVILGCTEIAMLVGQRDTKVPLYDTTALHAQRAVAWALND